MDSPSARFLIQPAAVLSDTSCNATQPGSISNQDQVKETFRGFIQSLQDAKLLVAACTSGLLSPVYAPALVSSAAKASARSGSVFCVQIQGRHFDWEDGLRWSSAERDGCFLLHRELPRFREDKTIFKSLRKDTHSNMTCQKTIPLEPYCLLKRTISLTAHNGERFKVISYFYPQDVHLNRSRRHTKSSQRPLYAPSELPEFARFMHTQSIPHAIQLSPIMLPPSALPLLLPLSDLNSGNISICSSHTESDLSLAGSDSFDQTATPLFLPESIIPTKMSTEDFFQQIEALRQQRQMRIVGKPTTPI